MAGSERGDGGVPTTEEVTLVRHGKPFAAGAVAAGLWALLVPPLAGRVGTTTAAVAATTAPSTRIHLGRIRTLLITSSPPMCRRGRSAVHHTGPRARRRARRSHRSPFGTRSQLPVGPAAT